MFKPLGNRDTLEKSVEESIRDMDTLTRGILEDMSVYFVPIMRSKVHAFYSKKNVSYKYWNQKNFQAFYNFIRWA
jgi:hypothetical protein